MQSTSRHSGYTRTMRDLAAQEAPVTIKTRLARWRCRNQRCDRRIFTERRPDLAVPFARQTTRLAGIVRLLGHSAGGRPSERLMTRLGKPVSATTILRNRKKRAIAWSDHVAVFVAGIDDWAWRKGLNYGTIIVDQERRPYLMASGGGDRAFMMLARHAPVGRCRTAQTALFPSGRMTTPRSAL